MANRYVYRDKARHPRARSARGGVVYLAYVPYLGMIYVICVTEECNYVRARTRPALRCLSAAFCALPRLHDCSKLCFPPAVGSKANNSEPWKAGRAVGTTLRVCLRVRSPRCAFFGWSMPSVPRLVCVLC